jgi:hypothetical protein
MTIRLNGSTSGYTEIDAPAVAGSNTLVLPTGNGSADQALVTNGSGTLSFADRTRQVLGTSVASTSGTAIDFTGIPSWVKRVTVMLNGVSLSGSSIILIQLGTSSGVETTGYAGSGSNPGAGIAQQYQSAQYTTGFGIGQGAGAAVAVSGLVFITAFGSSNKYIASGTLASTTEAVTRLTAGDKTLSGTLDRVRITSVNGTDTFDAGSINIMYEG